MARQRFPETPSQLNPGGGGAGEDQCVHSPVHPALGTAPSLPSGPRSHLISFTSEDTETRPRHSHEAPGLPPGRGLHRPPHPARRPPGTHARGFRGIRPQLRPPARLHRPTGNAGAGLYVDRPALSDPKREQRPCSKVFCIKLHLRKRGCVQNHGTWQSFSTHGW